jgi:hypothetical protein
MEELLVEEEGFAPPRESRATSMTPFGARPLSSRHIVTTVDRNRRAAARSKCKNSHGYEVTSPGRPHRRRGVRGGHRGARNPPTTGADQLHRHRRSGIWRGGADVHCWSGDKEARERSVRRLPPSLPGLGEYRLVRRPSARRRENAHRGLQVRGDAQARVGARQRRVMVGVPLASRGKAGADANGRAPEGFLGLRRSILP